jgi:hypothetical protein
MSLYRLRRLQGGGGGGGGGGSGVRPRRDRFPSKLGRTRTMRQREIEENLSDKSKRQWLGLSCVETLMATIGVEE